MIVIALWHAVRRQKRLTAKGRFYLTRQWNLDVRKFKKTSEFLPSCTNQWTVRVVMSSVRSAQFVSSKLILKFFIFTYFIVFLYIVHTHPVVRSTVRQSLCVKLLVRWQSVVPQSLFLRRIWFYEQEQVPSYWKFGLQIRTIRTQRRSVKFQDNRVFYASNEVCFLKNRFHDSLSSSIFDKILLRILLSIR